MIKEIYIKYYNFTIKLKKNYNKITSYILLITF